MPDLHEVLFRRPRTLPVYSGEPLPLVIAPKEVPVKLVADARPCDEVKYKEDGCLTPLTVLIGIALFCVLVTYGPMAASWLLRMVTR